MKLTEEMVKVAAQAAHTFDSEVSAMFGKVFDPSLANLPEWARETHCDKARVVLEAALAVAPQPVKSASLTYISPSLPNRIRNLWKDDPSEGSVRTALKLAGDLIQELIDLRAKPVQVDEEKLAEVIRGTPTATGVHVGGDTSTYIARAVAEWLRGDMQ